MKSGADDSQRRVRPMQENGPGSFAMSRPEEMVVECGPLSADYTDTTGSAIELLRKVGVLEPEEQEWPSSSFGPVLPDVLERLKQARSILTAGGFLVVDDPLNPLGDGKGWVLRCEPTHKLSASADLADVVDHCLQAEGVKVAARPVRDGRAVLVALWDSGNVRTDGGGLPPLPQEEVDRKRASDITRVLREIDTVRGRMDDEGTYNELKAENPKFILFKECDKDPELKSLLLGIKGHHQKKAMRFAKQIAASHNGVRLNTIEKAWDRHNPNRRPRQRAEKCTPQPKAQRDPHLMVD